MGCVVVGVVNYAVRMYLRHVMRTDAFLVEVAMAKCLKGKAKKSNPTPQQYCSAQATKTLFNGTDI